MCNALVPSSSCRGGRRRRIFLMISNTALMLGLSVTLLQSSVSVIDKATLMMWQFFFFLSKTKTRRSHNLSAKVATELLKTWSFFFFWPNKAFCWKLATWKWPIYVLEDYWKTLPRWLEYDWPSLWKFAETRGSNTVCTRQLATTKQISINELCPVPIFNFPEHDLSQ